MNQVVNIQVVEGHRVASGLNGNPLFPGGTLKMQAPFFKALGLDIGRFHLGTLNVSIAPLRFRAVKPRFTFRSVKWHPTEAAEDFSFFDCRLVGPGRPADLGYIYYPHPDTKPKHFQKPDVLELLLPWIEGVGYGSKLQLEISSDQMVIGPADFAFSTLNH